MKKFLIIIVILMVMLILVAGTASAHSRFHVFGFFAFPPIVISPPPVYHYPGYYSPYPYYDYRVWVPGHWEWRWRAYGWQKVWIPGYWHYAP